ncbi:MAG: DUF4384 domain-containing protein [Bacteroidaceae bacterium]|nr:DUF4384 domain-containing protein [Bacteroidaceae bacterium]
MQRHAMKQALSLLLILFVLPVFSQKMKTVEGECVYHAPANISLEEAKRIALDRAKIQALANEFGTIVSQSTSTNLQNANGKSTVDFFSVGDSEVKGEWIEDIGEAKYSITYDEGMLIVKVSIKGNAREIVSAKIDLRARILRNGTADKFMSDEFRDGDELYLSFVSPVNGYLAVYLVDEAKNAYCLLPYRNQTDGICQVKANRRYLFFNTKEAEGIDNDIVDEYVMTCSKSSERNLIYLIFSPNPFTKATDGSSDDCLPRELDIDSFRKWMIRQRKHDEKMNTLIFPITIKNYKDYEKNNDIAIWYCHDFSSHGTEFQICV